MKKSVLLLTLMLLLGAVGTRAADAYAYYDPSDKSLNFCYDGNKSYWSKRYTVYNMNTGTNTPAWSSIASQVEWLYFSSSFKDYQPTTCYKWAYDMTNLKKVDFYGINTSKVTNMALMFYGCSKLTSLDVSKFNTANVTTMESMFGNCSSLTSLNVSGFNTAKVTNMEGMFWGCSGLTSLNVSNFNTSNVTSMHGMFWGCSKLSTLDLSSFNTAKVTSFYRMFRGCSNLETIKTGSWNTSNATDMSYMFYGCSKLTTLNDYRSFNTSKATDMSYMFYGCSKMTTLNISSWVVGSSTNTSNMLSGLSSLTSLSISSTLNNYLGSSACSGIGTASSPCKLNYMDNIHPTFTTITPNYVVYKSGYFKSTNMKAYANLQGDVLYFRYDDYANSLSGTVYNLNTGSNTPAWNSVASSVKTVSFVSSFTNARPTSTYKWFYNMSNLTAIVGLDYFNTSEVTNMASMYESCTSLASIDATRLNTAKVTDMSNMFNYCTYVKSIGFGWNFNTSKVTNMEGMFSRCLKLTNIFIADADIFNTSNVTNMAEMFYYCAALESFPISKFNTAKVTTMRGMFRECRAVKSFDLSNFNTANVTDMGLMFHNCIAATSIDVSKFNTAKVTDMTRMFGDCSKLEKLDISNFSNNANPNTSLMINACSGLKKLTVPSWANSFNNNACIGVGTASSPCVLDHPDGFTPSPTSTGDGYIVWRSGYFVDALRPYAVLNGTTLTFYYDKLSDTRTGTVYEMNTGSNLPGWYRSRTSVTNVVFNSTFANACPTSCYKWFYGMSKITSITGLNYLNTEKVVNFESMFEGCTKLASVDLSRFTTFESIYWYDDQPWISFNNMFKDCSSLTSLDLSNIYLISYDPEEDDSWYYGYYHKSRRLHCETDNMFSGCTALKKLSLPLTYEPQEWTEEEGSRTKWEYWATMNDMAATACQGVGTQSSPCELIYPSWFTPEPTSTGNGWYLWKGGYFKATTSVLIGDANGDGDVSVTDVLITVDYVLGNNPVGFIFANADVNGDNEVTIADVTGIVDLVLNNQSASAVANSRESVADAISLFVKDGHATVMLDNSEPFCAMQFTVTMPEGAGMGNIAMEPARSNGHQALMRRVAPGRYNVVVYANSGTALRDGSLPLLRFDIAGCQAADVSINDVQLVNSLYETVVPTGILTGISITEIDSDNSNDTQPYYNTVGIGTNTPTRGVYIRNGKKVVVK